MGRVDMIRSMTAISFGRYFLVKIYTGIPTSPATLKPMSCLLVRLKATFVLTFFKSFGMGTYAISYLPSSFILKSSSICPYTLETSSLTSSISLSISLFFSL